MRKKKAIFFLIKRTYKLFEIEQFIATLWKDVWDGGDLLQFNVKLLESEQN